MNKNYLTKQEIDSYIRSRRIFFARIVELPDYKETDADIKIAKINSEDVLKNSQYGEMAVGEIINFLPRDDGYTYGYVETKTKNKKSFIDKKEEKRVPKNIALERIDKLCSLKDKIDNCLVIFISIKTSIVIGYYKDATIYREMQTNTNYKYKSNTFKTSNNKEIKEIFYNFKTKNENAILLNQRFKINIKEDLHCGQSFTKYYDEKNEDFVNNVLLEKLLISK